MPLTLHVGVPLEVWGLVHACCLLRALPACAMLQTASFAQNADTAPVCVCLQDMQEKFKDFTDLPVSAFMQRMTEIQEQLCGASSVSLDEVSMLPGSSCAFGASSCAVMGVYGAVWRLGARFHCSWTCHGWCRVQADK